MVFTFEISLYYVYVYKEENKKFILFKGSKKYIYKNNKSKYKTEVSAEWATKYKNFVTSYIRRV